VEAWGGYIVVPEKDKSGLRCWCDSVSRLQEQGQLLHKAGGSRVIGNCWAQMWRAPVQLGSAITKSPQHATSKLYSSVNFIGAFVCLELLPL
jgi:hypothetical protein